MDSQREPRSHQSLNRQGSLYSLTLDEVQTHLGSSGKALGSMNLDELLKSVCSGSLTLPRDLSKKTVEEVWKDIQQDKNGGGSGHERRDKQPTLGEMTLEDLLLKAGVVTETVPGSNHGNGSAGMEQNITQVAPWVQYHQLPSMPQPQSFMPYPVADMQAMVSQSSLMVVEKTVERKQKRMIKNRESAARSRARKQQAYTHELEIKVSRLEEENERLRRQKEVEKILPSAPPPLDPKRQLRRTSSAPF
ncbi:BnaA09g36130D [Brassica napus]|uniref:BnaA09g36130D protein n=1 Tax=Brassica napus TaxID=3708 RepID=A0A078GPN9_BRANA|nr:BnaA09g36130D [Brassica napus]